MTIAIVGDPIRDSRIYAISIRKACQNFKRDIGAVERMLKVLTKSLKTNT